MSEGTCDEMVVGTLFELSLMGLVCYMTRVTLYVFEWVYFVYFASGSQRRVAARSVQRVLHGTLYIVSIAVVLFACQGGARGLSRRCATKIFSVFCRSAGPRKGFAGEETESLQARHRGEPCLSFETFCGLRHLFQFAGLSGLVQSAAVICRVSATLFQST